ncbi:MAG: Ig-like domain-containing protein, partial [Acidimicrobiaceae bacterium]|nr:Ig-like domain-containing protein [Acidimicrobiaceae bacterium]
EDTLGAGVDAFRLDVAEGADARFATTTLVTTTFEAEKVPFGGSVTYSMQLQDPAGDVHRGVDGVEPARWTLSVNVTGHPDAPEPPEETLVSDSSGEAVFSIPFTGAYDDPNPATPGDVLVATFTLIPADNAPPGFATVDADGLRATTHKLIFSDEAPEIATVTIDTPDYIHVSGRGETSNRVTVTVLDQYGAPLPGTEVRLRSAGANIALDSSGPVDSTGSSRFSYRYSGEGRVTETLTADASGPGTVSETAEVHWTVDAGPSGTNRNVLAGDVPRRQIVVEDSGPVLLVYDSNDRFNLGGAPTTLAVFEAELAEALERDNPGRQLTWSNYGIDSSRPITRYNLS